MRMTLAWRYAALIVGAGLGFATSALAQDQSPDLTHVRMVKAGDTLPGFCEQIYGDPRLYLKVAAANGLDPRRALVYAGDLNRASAAPLLSAGARLVFTDSNRLRMIGPTRQAAGTGL